MNTQLRNDLVFGPHLFIKFGDDTGSHSMPSPREVFFTNLDLFGEHFDTSFKVTQIDEFETLMVVAYTDACTPSIPTGDRCIPHGVNRTLVRVTKNIFTGDVTEAHLSNGIRRINRLTGQLKNN